MSVAITPDVVGQMAIRLGRAYDQAWAKAIEKGTPWNWVNATEAIDRSRAQRRPYYIEAEHRINYTVGQTHWHLSQGEVRVSFLDKKAENMGRIELSDAISPMIDVRIMRWCDMDPNQLWRVDQAINSLSCARWKPLYSLPPVSVLTKLLEHKLPSCPVNLHYVIAKNADGETTPTINMSGVWASPEQHEEWLSFDRAYNALRKKGVETKWHRMTMA